jgi:hypothetical protein
VVTAINPKKTEDSAMIATPLRRCFGWCVTTATHP